MIRIVTDSTADLTQSMIAEYNIGVVPLSVVIEGQTYADGIELTKDQFYERMQTSKTLPTTSQPSPAMMRDHFQSILNQGDDVFYVGLSSTLSGTVQAAKIGRDLVTTPERVYIHDSLNVTFGQGLLAVEAAKLAVQGKSAEEIAAVLTEIRARQHIVFSVGTLENLRKSGRINNLSFLFGSLLSIKPILRYDNEGVVQVYEKVRGKKNAHQALLRFLEEHPPDPNFTIGVAHTYDPALAESVLADLYGLGLKNTAIIELCGVIGAHVGISTVGLIYVEQAR